MLEVTKENRFNPCKHGKTNVKMIMLTINEILLTFQRRWWNGIQREALSRLLFNSLLFILRTTLNISILRLRHCSIHFLSKIYIQRRSMRVGHQQTIINKKTFVTHHQMPDQMSYYTDFLCNIKFVILAIHNVILINNQCYKTTKMADAAR